MNREAGKGSKRRPGTGYSDNYLQSMGWRDAGLHIPPARAAEFRKFDGVLYWRELEQTK